MTKSILEIRFDAIIAKFNAITNNTYNVNNFYIWGHKRFETNEGRPPQIRVRPTNFRVSDTNENRQTRHNADTSDIAQVLTDLDIRIWGRDETEALYMWAALKEAIAKTRFDNNSYFQPSVFGQEANWFDVSDRTVAGYVIQTQYTLKSSIDFTGVITASINQVETERLFISESIDDFYSALPSGSFTVADALDSFFSQSFNTVTASFVSNVTFDTYVSGNNNNVSILFNSASSLQNQIDNLIFPTGSGVTFEIFNAYTASNDTLVNQNSDDIVTLFNSASNLQNQITNIDLSDYLLNTTFNNYTASNDTLVNILNVTQSNLVLSTSNNTDDIVILYNSASDLQTQINNLPTGSNGGPAISERKRYWMWPYQNSPADTITSNLAVPTHTSQSWSIGGVFHLRTAPADATIWFFDALTVNTNDAGDNYGLRMRTNNATFRTEYADTNGVIRGSNIDALPAPLSNNTYAIALSYLSGAIYCSINGSNAVLSNLTTLASWAPRWAVGITKPLAWGRVAPMTSASGSMLHGWVNATGSLTTDELKNWTAGVVNNLDNRHKIDATWEVDFATFMPARLDALQIGRAVNATSIRFTCAQPDATSNSRIYPYEELNFPDFS